MLYGARDSSNMWDHELRQRADRMHAAKDVAWSPATNLDAGDRLDAEHGVLQVPVSPTQLLRQARIARSTAQQCKRFLGQPQTWSQSASKLSMRCVIRGLYKAAPVMSCGIVEGCLTTARSNLIRISALRIPAHTKVSAARPKLLPKENQRRVASQQSRCSSSTRSHRKHAVVCRSSGTQMELSTELVDDLLRRIKGSGRLGLWAAV